MSDIALYGDGLARGVCRHLSRLGYAALTEFVPSPGLRVDVIALGRKGEIWIIECKSGRADFNSDNKWEAYLPWCDRFFWAVAESFPVEILPVESGLIICDEYDAEIQRDAPLTILAAARRKSLTLKLARTAAQRLLQQNDLMLSGARSF